MANKFGLKREDFASYEDYRREYKRLSQREYQKTEAGKLTQGKWAKSTKGKIAQEKYAQSEKGRAKIRAYQREYSKTESYKEYREKFRQTDTYKKLQKDWTQSEHGLSVKRKIEAKRRAAIKRATPPWVDMKEINKILKNCPKGLENDHIIALQGKNFSGLHVPWNLQYLTKSENSAKGNKLPKEY